MTSADVWAGLTEFHELLRSGVVAEAEYQRFFESNGWAFDALGYDRYEPFEKKSGNRLPYDREREYQPEPDFILANSKTGEVCVFELKTPEDTKPLTARASDGQRKKLRASIESYVSQCMEYVGFIAGDVDARKKVSEILQINSVSTVSAKLIYGEGFDDAAAVVKIVSTRTPKIEIVDFESLLDQLLHYFAGGRRDAIPKPGLTFGLLLILAPHQLQRESYICDVGGAKKNRLSVMLIDNQLVLRLIDRNGINISFEVDVPIGKPFSFRVEAANTEHGRFISLFIDEREVEAVSSIKELNIDYDFSNYTMGADIAGNKGISCKMIGSFILLGTLSLKQRLDVQRFWRERFKEGGGVAVFSGAEHMYMAEDSSLKADEGARPSISQDWSYD